MSRHCDNHFVNRFSSLEKRSMKNQQPLFTTPRYHDTLKSHPFWVLTFEM